MLELQGSRHEELSLNHFRAKRQYSSGVVGGLNNKVRVALAHGFGHRSSGMIKLVFYHTLGKLPEPPWSHKFCRRGEKMHAISTIGTQKPSNGESRAN